MVLSPKRIIPALDCLLGASIAHAGYYVCQQTVVERGGNCPDGTIKMYISDGPVVSVSPASLSFGAVAVNSSSAAQTITVRNNTPYNVYLPSTLTLPANFVTGATTDCTQGGTGWLGPHGSCAISVKFTPTASVSYSGSALVTHRTAQRLTA